MIALHQRANDYARFLPAVNGNFARFTRKSPDEMQRSLPAGLTPRQLDFLDPGGLFHYPWALYTAAEGVGDKQPTMVSDRVDGLVPEIAHEVAANDRRLAFALVGASLPAFHLTQDLRDVGLCHALKAVGFRGEAQLGSVIPIGTVHNR